MLRTVFILALICSCSFCFGQRRGKDSIVKYLDDNLHFTTKSRSVFPAMAIRTQDHWMLIAAYPDTTLFLKAYFLDEDLTIKDGPFELYHPHKVPAAMGRYLNNVKQGVWRTYYENGRLKDSGVYKNNFMVGVWDFFSDSGYRHTTSSYTNPEKIIDTARGIIISKKESKTYILAGDTSIGHGSGLTIHYYKNEVIKDSGNFYLNRRAGEWKFFYDNGKLESFGSYVNGRQHGDWAYFRKDGTRSSKEKYQNNKVIALECFDEQGNYSGFTCPLSKPPVAQGDFLDFHQWALDNMFWPEELKNSFISGNVDVEYTITMDGKMKDFKILRSPHPAMTKEVKRFFETLEWSPAVSHNRPVDYKMSFTVPFYR